MCEAFGVDDYKKLAGKEGFALYSFGKHNELIEGLESKETGRRFTNTKWARATFGNAIEDPLTSAKHRLQMELHTLERRRVELARELVELPSKYVDWSR